MKKINYILLLASVIFLSACEQVVFLPVEGTIEGIVRDNNGAPVEGVQVSATFEEPSSGGQAFEKTKSTMTLSDGFYRLTSLWDEVTLKVNHSGFLPASTLIKLTSGNNHPTVSLMLVGSPTITAVNLSKATLSASEPDTLTAAIEVLDEFNSLSQGYVTKLLLLRQDGTTTAISDALLTSEGLKDYLFQAIVTSDNLSAGRYQVMVEVRDPDGNEHRTGSEEIIVE